MYEYTGEAIVLNREDLGDLDARITLFSRQFGKFVGKAKSIRKITSKLSAHLEPGNIVRVRLIEQRGLQVVDALKIRRSNVPLTDISRIAAVLPDGQPDPDLWQMFASGGFSWPVLLSLLGWHPQYASCGMCGVKANLSFHVASQVFFCKNCAFSLPQNEIIYI